MAQTKYLKLGIAVPFTSKPLWQPAPKSRASRAAVVRAQLENLRVQPPFAKRQSGFNTTVATLPSGRLTVSVIASACKLNFAA